MDILNEPVPTVQKLTSEQIKNLPFYIIQFIREAEEPLKRLQKVVNDFPKHGHIIANFSRDSKVMNELNMNTRINSVTNGLWMNHVYLETNQLDIFSLLPKMRREAAIFSAFASLGYGKDAALEILTAPLMDSSLGDMGPLFDFDTKHVIWWNNVEKDKRYYMFPSDIQAVIYLF